MSIVLVVIGVVCVAAAFGMVAANKANDRAGGSGLGKFSIEGPAWIVVLALGIFATGWGVVRWEERNPPKAAPEAIVPATVEIGDSFDGPYDFGDNDDLDQLWVECAEGDWAACDDLYFQSAPGSEYEYFGASCGWRVPEPTEFCDPANNEEFSD